MVAGLKPFSVAWAELLLGDPKSPHHGGIFTVISPITAELFGIRSHGALFGIVAFSGTVGGAIGPILAGLVFDMTGSYQLIFLVLIGLAAVSLMLTLSLRPARS